MRQDSVIVNRGNRFQRNRVFVSFVLCVIYILRHTSTLELFFPNERLSGINAPVV